MSAKSIFVPYRSVPVLLYHQIADTTPGDDRLRLGVSPRVFDAHMGYLYRNGYRTIRIEEHLAAFSDPVPPDKIVVITFDDGYLDNYINAFPILQKYGFTATVFMVSGFAGKRHAWDGCHMPVQYMGWSHAREMQKFGVCFGCHTRTHPDLTAIPASEVTEEISCSRKSIEDNLGEPVHHFSYPFGRYNPDVIGAVRDCGFESAYSVGSTEWHRYTFERFMITSRDSMSLFRLKASGRASWIRGIYKSVGGKGNGRRIRPDRNLELGKLYQ